MGDLFGWLQFLPDLIPGLWEAAKLTAMSLLIGYPLGLLFAVLTSNTRRSVRIPFLAIVEIGRGVPLLVLLLLVYQGFPQVGYVPSAIVSAVAAFAFSAAAYSAEILRAALGAVSPGQREAAAATGMAELDSFRDIVLPQAARIAVPPLLNLAIQFFQLTSLAYLVTVPEIMQAAFFQGTVTFDYLSVFTAAAFLYAAITIPSAALIGRLEARLARHL